MIPHILNKLQFEWADHLDKLSFRLESPLTFMTLGTPEDKLGKAIIFIFGNGDHRPRLIAKIARTPEYYPWVEYEHEVLQELSSYSSIKNSIPIPLALFRLGNEHVALETVVSGTQVSTLLNRWQHLRPHQVRRDVFLVHDWLIILKKSTQMGEFVFPGSAYLEDRIAQVRPHLSELGFRNLDMTSILAQADTHQGMSLPLAGQHGDLWPNNCFFDQENFGVIDWENYSRESFPLYDLFFYLTTYAFAYPWSKLRQISRPEIFIRSIFRDTWYAHIFLDSVRSYFKVFTIPTETAQIFYFQFLIDAALHYAGRNVGRDNIWLFLIPIFLENQASSIFSRMC